MGFFNRIRADPGFVSPVRSDPIRFCQFDPIRSDPIRSDPDFVNGRVFSVHWTSPAGPKYDERQGNHTKMAYGPVLYRK